MIEEGSYRQGQTRSIIAFAMMSAAGSGAAKDFDKWVPGYTQHIYICHIFILCIYLSMLAMSYMNICVHNYLHKLFLCLNIYIYMCVYLYYTNIYIIYIYWYTFIHI